MMGDGALDAIVAKVEAYLGQFLGTRAQLLDAQGKINSALSVAQRSGSATIGVNTFTLSQLQSLSADNTSLLARNADLTNQIASFKDQVASVQSAATDVMDYITPGEGSSLIDSGIVAGVGGPAVGGPEVVLPAVYLVGIGAVLATSIYIFLGNVKDHLGSVAGEVGSNFIIYGGLALLGLWYAKKKNWL